MTIKAADLIEALKARWLLVAAIAGVLFAIVAGIALMQPRQYLASSSLLLDLSQTDPTDSGQQQQARVETDSIIATQLDLIKSAKVVNLVARQAGFVDATPADLPAESRLQQAAARVRAGLNVVTGRQSNVLQIQFLDPDPAVAARVANLTAQIYMREQVALRASTAQGSAQWFEARTADVRRRYEVAQKKLSDFQRAHDIIGMNRMDLEAEKLKNLSAYLTQAQADAAAAHSKSGSAAVPEVATALVVQNIQEAIATQAAKVAELSKSLGPNHPQMIAAKAQLAELQGNLRQARSVQASSMTANSSAASRREAELRAEMAAQEDRMIRMSGVQDQLMVMQRDVEAARQTYDTVRQRFNEAALKSQISQPNASLLDEATVPLFPARPNLPLWFVAGLALGLLAGVAAVVLSEILRPRVRTVNGLAAATEVEVIADLSPKSRPVGGLFVPRQEAA
ncbi:exopolysaccharide biosynthesis protein [Sphingomonas psychrotolerans]|uniref:Exopolysaccharide biosynthesis protein n=1 Tax=Sphingomonas psychrotolerans TaxID=1327635 RepID=A0ABU3N5J5_9SPHN|nr:GNVR domain-containing protein [Sphingomonas psychrotolerans]MDT8759807.1 exopolysaccharide biosynthesis protein [Sphingomonas psychrotolerans]